GYQDKFHRLIEYFLERYGPPTDEVKPPEYYNDFRVELIHVLYHFPVEDDWIPVFTRTDDDNFLGDIKEIFGKFKAGEKVLKLIDGKKTVKELSSLSGEPMAFVQKVLDFACYEGIVAFENMIEPRDYVVSTQKFQDLLNDQERYQDLKKQFEFVDLVALKTELDKVARIKMILKKFGSHLLIVLKHFHSIGLIKLLNDQDRKLILTLDISNEYMEILNGLLKKKEFEAIVLNIINGMDVPFLRQIIKFEPDGVFFEKNGIFPLLKQVKNIDDLLSSLSRFIDLLIEKTYHKVKRKANEKIYNKLVDEYLDSLHESEMAVLDSFLYKFEKAFTN
ncbi:MAG: hypothetical protein ACTSVI_07520, partial [Promethearchaeota archaeon]